MAVSAKAAKAAAAASLDVLTCTAGELANFLLEKRFENDGMAATAFLLESTQLMPGAEAIAAEIMDSQQNDNDDNEEEEEAVVAAVTVEEDEKQPSKSDTTITSKLGPPLPHPETPVEVSLTNPRGKFQFTFYEQGIYAITTNKLPTPLTLPAGCVRDLVVFPKPTDCQRTSSNANNTNGNMPMVLACFKDTAGITFKEKPLAQICFAIPADSNNSNNKKKKNGEDDEESDNDNKKNKTKDAVSEWLSLLCTSLQVPHTKIYRIPNPNDNTNNKSNAKRSSKGGWVFKSHQEANKSTTHSGMPFVKCYYGVQDGCLYPMEQGLLFFKPPLFVPRSKLHSIACGRGTGAQSRYVDMRLTIHDDDNDDNDDAQQEIEFTNIDRHEVGELEHYIHHVLIPAMQRDSVDNDNDNSHHSNGSDDDDDDDEAVVAAAVDSHDDDDDDIEMVKVVEGDRSKRRAARNAWKQNHSQQQPELEGDDSDEEDEDYRVDADSDAGSDDDAEDEALLLKKTEVVVAPEDDDDDEVGNEEDSDSEIEVVGVQQGEPIKQRLSAIDSRNRTRKEQQQRNANNDDEDDSEDDESYHLQQGGDDEDNSDLEEDEEDAVKVKKTTKKRGKKIKGESAMKQEKIAEPMEEDGDDFYVEEAEDLNSNDEGDETEDDDEETSPPKAKKRRSG